MSFHRYYNTFHNMNRQQSQSQDDLHNLVTNTNNIINIQSQVITNLNSNIVNLTRMIYNLENQIVNIQSTLNNQSRNTADSTALPEDLQSFNTRPNNTTSTTGNTTNQTNLSNRSNQTNLSNRSNQTNRPNINLTPNLSSQNNIQSNLRYPTNNSLTSSTMFDNIIDDIIFGSSPPSRRTFRPRRYPEVMEVTYSVDSRPSRSLVDLFRTINMINLLII